MNPDALATANRVLVQLRSLQEELIRQAFHDPAGVDYRYLHLRLSAITSEVEALQRYLSAVPAAHV